MTERSVARCRTGVDNLDDLVDGGVPEGRAVLVAGGPGTGKSSLGMAFLSAGVAADERCLFVAVEQTAAEARATLTEQGFELDGEGLAVASLQESVASFVGESEPTPSAVAEQLLSQYAPRDRVVFDDVGALVGARADAAGDSSAAVDGRGLAGRLVHDATRELTATTLLTVSTHAGCLATGAGAGGADGPLGTGAVADLAPLVDGVVTLTRERVAGDDHRHLRVVKLRGVDHERRPVEFHLGPGSPAVAPAERTVPAPLRDVETAPTDVDGLDALCGGGLLTGGGVLLQHDGRSNLTPLVAPLLAGALERGYVLELVPTVHLGADRLRTLLAAFGFELESLLAEDRLFVFDMVDAWAGGLQNVFGSREELPEVRSMLSGIADRTDGPHFRLVNADALAHTLGPTDARALRHYHEAELVGDADQVVHLQHPAAVADEARAAYEDAADQVLSLTRESAGREYVALESSPVGAVGESTVVSYTDTPPYVALERPPRSG
ncbi:MAG: RAD55 family ATPase [Halobacteriaceae archaeon]